MGWLEELIWFERIYLLLIYVALVYFLFEIEMNKLESACSNKCTRGQETNNTFVSVVQILHAKKYIDCFIDLFSVH